MKPILHLLALAAILVVSLSGCAPLLANDRPPADADLERLLDGDAVVLARAGRQPDDLDLGRRVRGCVHRPRIRSPP